MKLVTRLEGFADPKTTQLARDVTAGFVRVLEGVFCYTSAVWQEPFTLTVPSVLPNEVVRKSPPVVITCERAVNVDDRSILICPGGVSWEWVGGGKARLDAVGGLTVGVRYDLTFLALGVVVS